MIRKRVDQFGVGEPVISPVGADRILVQIPGLDTAKIQEARTQLSRVAQARVARLSIRRTTTCVRQIEAGEGIIPPDYRMVVYKFEGRNPNEKREEKLLVRKRAGPDGRSHHERVRRFSE